MFILKALTALEIIIPTHLLFSFFEDGVNSMKKSDAPPDQNEAKSTPQHRSICKISCLF